MENTLSRRKGGRGHQARGSTCPVCAPACLEFKYDALARRPYPMPSTHNLFNIVLSSVMGLKAPWHRRGVQGSSHSALNLGEYGPENLPIILGKTPISTMISRHLTENKHTRLFLPFWTNSKCRRKSILDRPKNRPPANISRSHKEGFHSCSLIWRVIKFSFATACSL